MDTTDHGVMMLEKTTAKDGTEPGSSVSMQE